MNVSHGEAATDSGRSESLSICARLSYQISSNGWATEAAIGEAKVAVEAVARKRCKLSSRCHLHRKVASIQTAYGAWRW